MLKKLFKRAYGAIAVFGNRRMAVNPGKQKAFQRGFYFGSFITESGKSSRGAPDIFGYLHSRVTNPLLR